MGVGEGSIEEELGWTGRGCSQALAGGAGKGVMGAHLRLGKHQLPQIPVTELGNIPIPSTFR